MTAQVERDDVGWHWFCGDCLEWSRNYTHEHDAVADADDHDHRWHRPHDDDPDRFYDHWREDSRG